jgi:hypothetical protein
MATGQGTILFDFGAVPGSNIDTTVVADAGISSGSKVEIYLMGMDSTATHNAVEHRLLPLGGVSLQCISITAGVGFTAQMATQLRLTGVFQARYVWAD